MATRKPQDDESLERKPTRKRVEVTSYQRLILLAVSGFFFPPLQLAVPLEHSDLVWALLNMLYLLVDPLFLYTPLINEHTKSLLLDNTLKRTALVLRSFGDVGYLIRIYLGIMKSWGKWASSTKKKKFETILWLANYTWSVLPMPQVAILISLPRMKNTNYINFFLTSQYVTRIVPIYIMGRKINNQNLNNRKEGNRNRNRFLIILNIFAYFIAGHIFGAAWYFQSIQRELQCWKYACRVENGYEFTRNKNITLIMSSCPIPPAKEVFHFGIYQYVLQSGMQTSRNFPGKWLQCFSWGLRNLSSFGSNLDDTSAYVWENFFVVAISINGLILFTYLLGHVQVFMQAKINIFPKKMDIPSLLSKYGLSDENDKIIEKIKDALKTDPEVDENYTVENMSSILSLKEAKTFAEEIKSILFLDKLKKVKGLEHKDDLVLREICEHLKPMIYSEREYMIQEREPLDMMFFLTQGSVLIYDSSGSARTIQEKEIRLFGEVLLTWAAGPSTHQSNLPFSTETVKARNKVEVFAITATDLKAAVDSTLDDIHINIQ